LTQKGAGEAGEKARQAVKNQIKNAIKGFDDRMPGSDPTSGTASK
jgi:hypothetical protein